LIIGTKRLQLAGQIPVMMVTGGEGELAGEDQGTRAVLARGDMQVGVSWIG
jgi:hypothetical protein